MNEITQLIKAAREADQLSDEADKLINEITLMLDTLKEAALDMNGVSCIRESIRMEIDTQSTDVLKELAEISGEFLYKPSEISPYYWIYIRESIEGVDHQIHFVIHGTRYEITTAWKETQTH